MADKSISELAAASQVGSTDLFVLEQGNVAKKLTGQILENWLVAMADGHGGIQTIEKTGTSGNTDTYTITFADETTSQFTVNNGNGITGMTSSKSGRITTVTFAYSDGTSSSFTISDGEGISNVVSYWAISTSKTTQPSSWQTTPQDMTSTYKYLWSYMRINYTDGTHQDTTPAVVGIYGDKGDPGNTGTSITNVAKISTSGLIDTYRITFSNGTNTTFQVTNGSDIDTIELTSTSGLVDTYTVTLTNGETSTFQVTNGKGISSIQMISGSHAAGTSDTYRITYNDGDTFDFLVYNGANGTGAVSTVAGIGVSGDTGDVPLILWGNSAPTSATVGQLKQLYFDLSGGVMYICVGVAAGSYSWVSMGITVDSALSTTSNNPVRNSVISQKVGTESLSGFTATNLTTAANELKTTKAEKSAAVSTIRYNDNNNHKLQKTINGTTTDVMTVDTEPTDGSMNPITSDAAYELKGSLTQNNSNIAYVENGNTASRNFIWNDYVVVNGQLYKVKTNISQGDTFTVGTNIETAYAVYGTSGVVVEPTIVEPTYFERVSYDTQVIGNFLFGSVTLKCIADVTSRPGLVRFNMLAKPAYGWQLGMITADQWARNPSDFARCYCVSNASTNNRLEIGGVPMTAGQFITIIIAMPVSKV